MEDRSNDAWIGLFAFACTGASVAGVNGALTGAIIGYLVGRDRARCRDDDGRRRALQHAADEARSDELCLVTNHLHASGIPTYRAAAGELSALVHRTEDVDPT